VSTPESTAPVGTTTRAGRSRVHTLGAGAAVLAALAVGHVMVTAFPVDDRVSAPFVRTTAVGETVELRYARLTAGEPTGSTVVQPDPSTQLSTPGVFVMVPLTIVATGQPRLISFAELVGGDGRTYTVSTSGRSSFLSGTAQPGVPRYATVVVELPPDALPGAHLRIGLSQDDQRGDDLADVDLGLTQADAEAWAALDTPHPVPPPSDEPPGQS
jgi:hypothetical protein